MAVFVWQKLRKVFRFVLEHLVTYSEQIDTIFISEENDDEHVETKFVDDYLNLLFLVDITPVLAVLFSDPSF